MKYYKKQKIGENLLYVMVWLAILLVPILNSKMMSEVHVSLSNILIAWQQIAPYLFIFIIHNAFIVRYVKRHQYMRYVVVDVLFISAVFYGVDILDRVLGDFATPEHLISAKHASFTDLPVYWNIVLGLFMTCANTAIKMMYQSLRDEQAMEELKRQNLQAEMDYLKYQINPHFFMNTLNNIHSLIDIDAAYAQDAVIELSKMMRYVLYESGHEAITLEKDIQFMENYIKLMRIRYTEDVDIRFDYPNDLPHDVTIPPLLLIVFVENAFKHGISYSRPSFIHIRVRYIDGKVYYSIINSRHTAEPSGKDAGIGLENVRRRLQLIFANRQFLHNHGIPESEEIGKLKIYEIAGDMNTQEDWHERCKDILHGGSRSFVAHHPSKVSKNILAYEGIMYNVTNDSGEESYWSFSHDISERLHYEAQIKRLNLIMDTTIDNLPAGIVVKEINNDFRYIYRNRESYNRNLCIGESIGKNDFDYYPPEVAEKKREEDTLVATTGRGLHWTTEGKDKNGNEIILDKRKIRVDGDELSSPIIVSIEWDITELEKIKRELQTSKEKAEMSDKLKSAFLANMSHEIRTPLNAIVGFSHLIAESENKEERKTFYEIVEANNERLLQLINEILDLSKIESGIIEFTSAPININSLCKEVHDAHVFRTPQGVQLIYEPSENGLVIETDKNRVFQVFSNLIGNAFKFTKAGSISYGYKLVGNQIVFHVTDTGTGIEPEKIGRVFERFAKLNNYAQGTGLGLSICKTIVERLGGEISVSSVVGQGTTFTFTLPYESEQSTENTKEEKRQEGNANENPTGTGSMKIDPASTETPAETSVKEDSEKTSGSTDDDSSGSISANASPSQRTILIAEDEDSNFDLLKAILGRKYRLIRARDGMEAVTSYDEAKPDLILMDIKMPNLDGLEATKIIRELSHTVPIIAQSAYAYQQDQIAAMDAGCSDFIAKPISQAKLKDMINKWLP